MAIETYKKVNKRLFPSWDGSCSRVMLQLGYRKVEARNITMENVPEATIERRKSA
jgi:hypothetical protein